MPVLVGLGLEEVHGWKIARVDCGKEIVDVILMVRGAGVPYLGNGRRSRVGEVGRRRIVLEPGVMLDVVSYCRCKTRRASLATRGAIVVLDREFKPTHERPPTHTRRI